MVEEVICVVVLHKCDVCGKIADEGEDISCRNRVMAKIGIVNIQVKLGVNGTWNDGHICNECLANILRQVVSRLEKEPYSVRKVIWE